MSDTKFGTWSVAESPLSIEYSLVVIEEIRHEVAEGFQRLSRGGIEVGGVLYGTREGRTVRVLAMRPITCEHARGPAFLLSDKDRVSLNEQLARDQEDPHLEGLISVGWFLSHTRSEIMLTESDLEIYTIFFQAPWQIALVIRPGRGGSMRAGFFVREADGTVKSEQSYFEFNFPDRLAGVLDRSPDRAPRERPSRRIPSFYRADTERQEQVDQPPEVSAGALAGATVIRRDPLSFGLSGPAPQGFAGPQLLPPVPRRKTWIWLMLAVAVLVAAGIGWFYWMQQSSPDPLGLAVVEHDGQLRIQWNQGASKVHSATRGALEISDGGDPRSIALSREMLTSGNFTYVRKTGDVEVRMTVESPDGARWQEASRYLGRPPGPAAAADPSAAAANPSASSAPPPSAGSAVQDEEVQATLRRLRSDNARQADRIQQLERTIRLMQGRGIEPPKDQ
jgi:proteasome lid subunit RPN8/RPN11